MFDFERIADSPRMLMEAALRPVQGTRFQPTGFPDLGAAAYTMPDGTQMLLVESAQSMANRLERVCWDDATDDLVPILRGMPYVRVNLPAATGMASTSSILEFHRLNSPYIMSAEEGFNEKLAEEAGLSVRGKKASPDTAEKPGAIPGMLDIRALAKACFRHDPGSVLHGVFLEKIDGRARLTRLLSAFIEAKDVRPAESGGVKIDRVNPSGPTAQGYGNVPFHRTEYVAGSITAYFSLDLGTLRGYGLGELAERFLVLLALWKIRSLLETGMRLRTACDLEVSDFKVTRPSGLVVPPLDELAAELQRSIAACSQAGLFADPPCTQLTWTGPKADRKKVQEDEGEETGIEDEAEE